MRHSTLALAAVLSMPVGANGDISFDNFFPGHEGVEFSGSGGNLSGDSLGLKREYPVLPSLAFGGEYSTARLQGDADRQTTILQGLLYIPDEKFTLLLGAGWLATRTDTDDLRPNEDRPIVSLQGRLRFSRALCLLLGVDRIELDSDAKTNVYRTNLLMSDGESLVDIVLSYEFGDTVGSQNDEQTYELGVRGTF